ncbi:MAG: DoxX family protein [Bacteroidota bacterium]
MEKTTRIIYWTITGVLALFMSMSGLGSISGVEEVVQSVTGLGYPTYFIPFLGAMKLLGGITILLVKIPQIKIGAYAGAFFWSIGGIFSHFANSDPFAESMPLILAFLLIGSSFYLWNRYIFSPKLTA